MVFILLLGLSSLLVAGAAAYFSILGIATLFVGSYYQVMVMAGSLEFGKLIAASYLHRYWNQTSWWLKTYLCAAVAALMVVTSIGIFGYLSAAYQVNSAKFGQIDSKMELIENQKLILEQEINQNNKRLETLNEVRKDQEQRVQQAGNYKAPREQAYASIEKANNEIQTINVRNQQLQEEKFKKDAEVLELKNQISQAKDIGTFKFFADYVNKPLDTVVIWFILCLMCVFDPLAVSLVLAFNTAVANRSASSKKSTIPSSVITNNVNPAQEIATGTIQVQQTTDETKNANSAPKIVATGYAIPKNR